MTPERPAVAEHVDLTFEELDEVTGADTASTAGTVSTPATIGTAACLNCF
jgi:hypothetical protein